MGASSRIGQYIGAIRRTGPNGGERLRRACFGGTSSLLFSLAGGLGGNLDYFGSSERDNILLKTNSWFNLTNKRDLIDVQSVKLRTAIWANRPVRSQEFSRPSN